MPRGDGVSDWVDRFLVSDIHATPGMGRVLDLPAGGGELSRLLEQQGYDVAAADLFPERCEWDGRTVRADMLERLPFEAGAFDAIVCQEGVKHLEDVASFFRECRRVLRDGSFAG